MGVGWWYGGKTQAEGGRCKSLIFKKRKIKDLIL